MGRRSGEYRTSVLLHRCFIEVIHITGGIPGGKVCRIVD